jgi:predicted Rossmann fold nucleotide-binding protein DprA/Smf involved in DNA uptake
VLNQQNRIPLKEDRLVLISPYHPGPGFNAVNDLQRNKLIYALADAALIISSDYQKGGVWAGVVEQLEKLKFVTVYVRSTGVTQRTLQALISKGARSWPNPKSVEDFNEALALNTLDVHAPPQQAQFSFEDLF